MFTESSEVSFSGLILSMYIRAWLAICIWVAYVALERRQSEVVIDATEVAHITLSENFMRTCFIVSDSSRAKASRLYERA